jgi:hypothetical protein
MPQPPDVAGEAEHQEQVADDAPRNRGLDDLCVMRAKRDDRDDQLGGVAECRVEKAAERRSGSARQMLVATPIAGGGISENAAVKTPDRDPVFQRIQALTGGDKAGSATAL